MIRLQKYLAMCGVASRRKCEELILKGHVTINGRVMREMGVSIDPYKDYVKVDGKLVRMESVKVYILMNKPSGVVTTSDDQFDRKTVLDLLEGKVGERVYPVGRLDYETEGLILLTNDGEFANKIMHPSSHLKKKYQVVIRGGLNKENFEKLQTGVDIGDGVTSAAEIKLVGYREGKTELEVTISEGKNRQIRRMFEAVDHEVIFLKRVSIGPIRDGSLRKGEWRHLSDHEVKVLKEECEKRRNRKAPIVNELLVHYEEKVNANEGKPNKKKTTFKPNSKSNGKPKEKREKGSIAKKVLKAVSTVKSMNARAVQPEDFNDQPATTTRGSRTNANAGTGKGRQERNSAGRPERNTGGKPTGRNSEGRNSGKPSGRPTSRTSSNPAAHAPDSPSTKPVESAARSSEKPKKRERINYDSDAFTTKRVKSAKKQPFAFKDSSKPRNGFR